MSVATQDEVYPRTGGGNMLEIQNLLGIVGLSPHGRGKLIRPSVQAGIFRSIPARAGETGRPSGWKC